MRLVLLLLSTAFLLSACKHPLTIVGEGDILSATGDRDCLLEQYQAGDTGCSENSVVDQAYEETYSAVARPGSQFVGWGSYCVKTTESICEFSVGENWVRVSEPYTVPPLTAYFRETVNSGHNAVMMGHSFFSPISSKLQRFADSAGFTDHVDTLFFEGHAGGAPIRFWESDQQSAIMQALDNDDVTLLGLTYFPLSDYEYNLQGYINWVEYAAQANPDIEVFLAAPWSYEPALVSAEVYREEWEIFHLGEFHTIVDDLRTRFPDLNIYCIPYGRASIELKALFEAGNLPDIEILIDEENNNSLYNDDFGHPSLILSDLATLIWLKSIYGVDMTGFDHQTNFTIDLTQIAEDILLSHDHDYDAR